LAELEEEQNCWPYQDLIVNVCKDIQVQDAEYDTDDNEATDDNAQTVDEQVSNQRAPK